MEDKNTKPSCLRRAGQYQDEQIDTLLNEKVMAYASALMTFIIFLGYEWILWFIPSFRNPLYLTIGFIPVATVVIWKIFKIKKQIQKHKRGSFGEKIVADELEKIKRQGFMVIHDFQHRAVGNIDHIVIGPKGIFALETKNYSKPDDKSRIFYDGEHIYRIDSSNSRTLIKNDGGKTPSQQAAHAAAELKNMLCIDFPRIRRVNPIVVFPGWEVKLGSYDDVPNVRVCNEQTIHKQFVGRDGYFQDFEISQIYEFLAENNKNM